MMKFPLRNVLFLAPMVGITNRAFRTLVQELGSPDFYMTEMASAEALISGGRNESIYLDPNPCPEKTSVQFTARTPRALASACSILAALPHDRRPAGVDINMGCAAPHIKTSGRGAALLNDPVLAQKMVKEARDNWPGLLSAKIRISEALGEEGTLRFAQGIAEAGLDFIVVHARFDTQKFRHFAHYDFAARLSSQIDIPVIVNGDIGSAQDCASILAMDTFAGVMIGRAAVRKPWLFSELRALPAFHQSSSESANASSQKLDLRFIGLHFIDLVERLLPAEWQKESCRRVFSYFSENVSFAHYLKVSLANAHSLDEMRLILTRYFEEVPTDLLV